MEKALNCTDMDCLGKSPHAVKAMALFKEGYNCAQSVFVAFEEECGLERSCALKLSSSFGGGMGRLREVCGAVSGMFMVAGMLYGYDTPDVYWKNTSERPEYKKQSAFRRSVPNKENTTCTVVHR